MDSGVIDQFRMKGCPELVLVTDCNNIAIYFCENLNRITSYNVCYTKLLRETNV